MKIKEKAYNKLYYKGKPIGRAFVTGFKKPKESVSQFEMRVKKENVRWNKKVGDKRGYKAVFVGRK